jgi:hypothetical protein
MISDEDAQPDSQEDERLLAQIKGARLPGVGRGKLTLTNLRLEFEHRKGLLASPEVDLSVDLVRVFSARVGEDSDTLTIEWLDDSSAPIATHVALPQGDAAQRLYRILTSTLRRLKQEADLREHQALYQSFLWATAYQSWLAARLLGRIVEGLIAQDWDAVEGASATARDAATSLPSGAAPGVDDALQALTETVSSRDPRLVLRDVVAAYRALGESLNTDVPPGDKWTVVSDPTTPGMTWPHVRYIFLFAAWHTLLSVWLRASDQAKIDEYTKRLKPLLALLADAISPEIRLGSRAGADRAEGDGNPLERAARNLEALLKINAGIA